MAKPGDTYRELVGTVAAALDPGSTVKTEQWVEGPDGERDMDVEMRGTLKGRPQFVLIECKDHKRRIGIGYVDAFDSKIRDLRPDRAILFSNSGFTRDALRKAKRVGIEMASALKAKEKQVRVRLESEIIAKRVNLSLDTVGIHPFKGQPHEVDQNWNIADLRFDKLPANRWFYEIMVRSASEYESANRLKFLCTLRNEPRWEYQGRPIAVGGITVSFTCTRDWVSQTVQPDISLGYYDHLKKSVIIPPKQLYAYGLIDNKAWRQTNKVWDKSEMSPNSLRLFLTLIASNISPGSDPIPDVDELVAEQRIDVE